MSSPRACSGIQLKILKLLVFQVVFMDPVVKPIVPDIFLKDPDVIPAKAGIQTKKSLKLKIFYYIVFVK
ncbi:MAG TPA: hypothetical protein LFV92_03740 [Rickettsia endosymbiont of Ceroptres masudai]|nr:hypothetical protein [Rickettsia endosymbiont of Ceroptres masudai]